MSLSLSCCCRRFEELVQSQREAELLAPPQLRLGFLSLETTPAICALSPEKASYVWCTVDANYQRVHDSHSRLILVDGDEARSSVIFPVDKHVDGDVRMQFFLHRCKCVDSPNHKAGRLPCTAV
eukprot:SAG11_NODE_1379_length_5083_cov_3.259831_4_plen_124_part_00